MSIVLGLAGWEEIDHDTMITLENHKRGILVYPHTSRLDFLVYLFYFLRYNIIQVRTRVLINPTTMDRFGPVLKTVGGIRATPREETNGGAVEKIYDELKDMEEFLFLISPKGSREANFSWRTGYYYLAKKLDCYIIPGGLDFEKKKFVIKEPFLVGDQTPEEVEKRCKEALYDITPRYIEKSEFPIAAHTEPPKSSVGLLSWPRFIIFIILMILLIVLIVWIIYKVFFKRKINSDSPVGRKTSTRNTKKKHTNGSNSRSQTPRDAQGGLYRTRSMEANSGEKSRGRV